MHFIKEDKLDFLHQDITNAKLENTFSKKILDQ